LLVASHADRRIEPLSRAGNSYVDFGQTPPLFPKRSGQCRDDLRAVADALWSRPYLPARSSPPAMNGVGFKSKYR
jgi:hypothetical protein